MSEKQITVTIDLDVTEQNYLERYSLEFLLQNAKSIGQIAGDSKRAILSERGSNLFQDCQELEPLANKIWTACYNALRVTKSNKITEKSNALPKCMYMVRLYSVPDTILYIDQDLKIVGKPVLFYSEKNALAQYDAFMDLSHSSSYNVQILEVSILDYDNQDETMDFTFSI